MNINEKNKQQQQIWPSLTLKRLSVCGGQVNTEDQRIFVFFGAKDQTISLVFEAKDLEESDIIRAQFMKRGSYKLSTEWKQKTPFYHNVHLMAQEMSKWFFFMFLQDFTCYYPYFQQQQQTQSLSFKHHFHFPV